MFRSRAAIAAGVIAVAATSCTSAVRHATPVIHPLPVGTGVTEPTPPPPHHVVNGSLAPRLTAFASCQQLLQTVRGNALKHVTAYGLNEAGYGMAYDGVAPLAAATVGGGAERSTAGSTSAGSAGGTAASAPGPASAGSSYSGTNDQEQGVDEPDLTKTNGRLLLVVSGNPLALNIYDVGGDKPQLDSTMRLSRYLYGAQLFLVGNQAVVIGQAASSDQAQPQFDTLAIVIDLTEPDDPEIARTFRIPGSEYDARLISGHVVMVMQNSPRLRWSQPTSMRQESRTLAANKRLIVTAPIDQWLPPVSTLPSHHVAQPDCRNAYHAKDDSSSQTLSVVSFDPADEASVHQTTVIGTVDTVYASTTGLFLTSSRWQDGYYPMGGPVALGPGDAAAKFAPNDQTTTIQSFDLTDPANPRYRGAGEVPGTLIDQYSLSDYAGYLRVATTVGIPIPAPNEGATPRVVSDNRVSVLRVTSDGLVPAGVVAGLGRGERIYGVRFVANLGYVVTFRQIDPLYVIDLSDPAHPRSLGHLKVTGYSAYLHPLGDGMLFGLGRKVDPHTAAPLGEQLSVFDVSSPAHPTLLSRMYADRATSSAEDDHHAFLWWPADRLVIVPMSSVDSPGQQMVVYHVDTAGQLRREGAVTPPDSSNDFGGGVERAIVIGGLLYTVTDQGLLANDLHSLAQVRWLPFN